MVDHIDTYLLLHVHKSIDLCSDIGMRLEDICEYMNGHIGLNKTNNRWK
jgi:hypothetical protein